MSAARLPLADVEALHGVAADLAPTLVPGDVIGLSGDLGAGKTTFVRGLCAALGGDTGAITSPTFALIEVHPLIGDILLVHADLYRVADLDEARATGLFDYLGAPDCIVAVEWPEVLGAELRPTVAISLGMDDRSRWVRVERLGG